MFNLINWISNNQGIYFMIMLAFTITMCTIILKIQIKRDRRIYIVQRNEEVSRISDGVANGITSVFENESVLNAVNSGVVIKININVDGSKNIVITGSGNSVLND